VRRWPSQLSATSPTEPAAQTPDSPGSTCGCETAQATASWVVNIVSASGLAERHETGEQIIDFLEHESQGATEPAVSRWRDHDGRHHDVDRSSPTIERSRPAPVHTAADPVDGGRPSGRPVRVLVRASGLAICPRPWQHRPHTALACVIAMARGALQTSVRRSTSPRHMQQCKGHIENPLAMARPHLAASEGGNRL
jgi:hypothetical protein